MTRIPISARRTAAAALVALVVSSLVSAANAAAHPTRAGRHQPATPDRSAVRARLANLPLRFEANRGQTSAEARFVARGAGYELFLTPYEAVWSLDAAPDHAGAVVRMRAVGSSPGARLAGRGELPGRSNYLSGPSGGASPRNVPAYTHVAYETIYPGVDLVFHGTSGRPEYDFVVAPGASAAAIRLAFDGADRARVDANGDLVLAVAGREIRQPMPRVYQTFGGVARAVPAAYVVDGPGDVRFALGEYDRSRPLVVDPVVSFASFLGGDGYDQAQAIAVDAAGAVYVAGSAGSPRFPTTAGAYQTDFAAFGAAFVTKLDFATGQIVYSTFLAGSVVDGASDLAVDGAGAVYVAGTAISSDFPTTPGSFQTVQAGDADAFVAKLDPTGSRLVYSTFLGGSGGDFGASIAIDGAGAAVVTGNTASGDFPTTDGAVQPAFGGGPRDAFVATLDPAGASLVFATYLGGSEFDLGEGVAVDRSGGVYVTGDTASPDLHVTPGAVQPAHGGDVDVFVAKLDRTGRELAYLTYLGGSSADGLLAASIAVDADGAAYVTGDTESPDFPTTSSSFQPRFGGGFEDGFVAKLNVAGTAFVYSTFLGGREDDHGASIAVSASGLATVAGYTHSANFPLAAPALDRRGGGTLFESADSGRTWTHTAAGVPPSAVLALEVDPHDASRLYAGTELDGLYVSTDHGATWRASGAGLPPFAVQAIAADPASPATVYVAMGNDALTTGGVFKSTDGGATWGAAGRATLAAATIAIAISPSDPSILYAATFPGDDGVAGIFRSADGGATWTGPTLVDRRPTSVAVDPANPNVVYVGTFGQNVFKSTDGGRTWAARDNGLRFNPVSSIVFDPENPSAIYISTYASDRGPDGGVFRSTDGGATWVLSSPPFIAATAVRIDPSDSSKIYASAFNGVFETGDGGATWELSSLLGASAHAIAIDPSDGSRLVAGLSQPSDAFVTRLSADGSALVYSTYFGSTGPDEAFGVALDAAGDTYVTGATASATLATAGAFQPQHGGVYDGFVAKLVTGVAISGAELRAKRLVVSGDGFARGATVLVDGVALRTRADRRSPSTTLVVPNAVRAIAPGQTVTLAVRNRDGSVSPEYRFTRQ